MRRILYTEAEWCSSRLSVARHCGCVAINGNDYILVNKEGKDLWELTAEAEKEGRAMAIPPGEPADLILLEYSIYYRALGREKFLAIYNKHRRDISEEEIMGVLRRKCGVAMQSNRKNFRISKEQIAEVIRMHNEGMSNEKIADALGFSSATIRKYIKKYDERN